MAHTAGVKLSIDDFTRIGKKVPVLADLKPSGNTAWPTSCASAACRRSLKMLLDARLLHGDLPHGHRPDRR